jgi:phi13 family phage major tail protein
MSKVKFGLSDVHVGEYGVDTTNTPMTPILGAIELTVDTSMEQTPFYADNIIYYLISGQAEITGSLSMALFPDDFKKKYLGYKATASGALLQQVGKQDLKAFNLSFKIQKDDSEDVIVLYNVTGGAIADSYRTSEGTPAPEAEVLPLTIAGDTATKTWKMIVPKTNTGYATALTEPETPTAVEA